MTELMFKAYPCHVVNYLISVCEIASVHSNGAPPFYTCTELRQHYRWSRGHEKLRVTTALL